MEMKKVVSSNVEEIGFDKANGLMAVRFKGGALYTYDKVTEETHKSIMDSESIGSYIRKAISGLAYKKLSEEEEQALLGSVKEKPAGVKKAVAKHKPGTHKSILEWVIETLELWPVVSPVALPKDKCYKEIIKEGDSYYSGMFYNAARTEGLVKGFTVSELELVNSENALIDMEGSFFFFVKLS